MIPVKIFRGGEMRIKGKIKSTFIFVFILALLFPSMIHAQSYEGYSLIINNFKMDKALKTQTMGGMTYVPLHAVKDNLGIGLEAGQDILKVRCGTRVFEMRVDTGKAFHEAFDGMPLILEGDGVWVPVLALKDVMDFNIEVLADIKCLRIITKPNMLPAAQLMDRSRKVAYLTFDDGLEGKITPQILDILKRYHVKATFFIIGNTVNKNKALLKRIAEEGHVIGNHTYTHKSEVIYSNVALFSEELKKTAQAIADITGKAPTLFRPPYGMNYIKGEAYQNVLKQYKVVGWNVDSMDSRSKDVDSSQILGNVRYQTKTKDKAIILMHNSATRGETVKALPQIIEFLADNGYELLPLE